MVVYVRKFLTMKTKIILILCFISLILNVWSFYLNRKPQLKKVHLMDAYTIGWYEGYQRGLKDKTFGESALRDIRRMFVLDSCMMELSIYKIK